MYILYAIGKEQTGMQCTLSVLSIWSIILIHMILKESIEQKQKWNEKKNLFCSGIDPGSPA